MTAPRIALVHAKPGRKVLTSPHSAVTRLKQIFDFR